MREGRMLNFLLVVVPDNKSDSFVFVHEQSKKKKHRVIQEHMTIYCGIDIGLRNLAYCVLDIQTPTENPATYTVLQWKLVDVLKTACARTSTECEFDHCNQLKPHNVHDIARMFLPQQFPESFFRKTVAHVCIEQQPHGKYGNPNLVLFSHLIYAYFRDMQSRVMFGDALSSVRFVSANSKYRTHWIAQFALQKASSYAQRKQLSVKLATHLLKWHNVNNVSETELEAGHGPKQDDLADCFLLALP